ncbi:MAG TPA: hypothetical protein VGV59_01920 [Pyrinomonadaceae bacterium]|nr:hypothetical protein [Pyrinomonadaceae bacterium]
MRRLLKVLFLSLVASVALVGADSPAQGQRSAPLPRFEDYPVRQIYRGRVAPPRIDHRRARLYRTRLREDSQAGPNFAGRYTVVHWGCGTGCAQVAVVDARTGRVYWPPVDYVDIPHPDVDRARHSGWRLDSRLLVLTQSHYDRYASYTAFYYLFDNNRFRLLRKVELRGDESMDEDAEGRQ